MSNSLFATKELDDRFVRAIELIAYRLPSPKSSLDKAGASKRESHGFKHADPDQADVEWDEFLEAWWSKFRESKQHTLGLSNFALSRGLLSCVMARATKDTELSRASCLGWEIARRSEADVGAYKLVKIPARKTMWSLRRVDAGGPA